jgi:uncharacterized protein involved in exopolysaccharide biosynthesis
MEEARYSAQAANQSRTPLILEQISRLESRADALRTRYRDMSERLFRARNSARMEDEQKGERLSVIDPPVVPDKPLSPNRPLLVAGGIGAGLGAGLVLALLVELLMHPIRGASQIEKMLGVPPLVVIPTMSRGTHAPTRLSRWGRAIGRLWPFKRNSRAAA